jgi:hypothetical protein
MDMSNAPGSSSPDDSRYQRMWLEEQRGTGRFYKISARIFGSLAIAGGIGLAWYGISHEDPHHYTNEPLINVVAEDLPYGMAALSGLLAVGAAAVERSARHSEQRATARLDALDAAPTQSSDSTLPSAEQMPVEQPLHDYMDPGEQ